MGIYNLDKLFSTSPFSNAKIAIVGHCSCNKHSQEWQLYHNLISSGERQISLVNVDGSCRPDCPIPRKDISTNLNDIYSEVNLVVSLISLEGVPDLVESCAKLGVSGLIVMNRKSDGAADFLEREIVSRARKHRLRILGLNSSGFIIPSAQLNLSFLDTPAAEGSLALLSQSGAVITSILGIAQERNAGFSHVIGLGALSDINFGDMIDYLGWSAKVSCILLHIENIKDVKMFMSACRSVAMIKPIVAIKAGKSELSRRVIEKHTGRPSGEDQVYDTAFRRAGIIQVDCVDELVEAGDFLTKNEVPQGSRLGIITNSGGLGILAVDILARKNIPVTELSSALGKKLGEYITPYSGSLDPICIASDADKQRYRQVLDLVFSAGEFDTVVVIMVLSQWLDPISLVDEMRAAAAKAKINMIYVWIGAQADYVGRAAVLNDRTTRICFTIRDAVLSCYYALRYYEKLSKLLVIPKRYNLELSCCRNSTEQARKLVENYLDQPEIISIADVARKLLAIYGLPINPVCRVASAAEVGEVCSILGFPVVMKIASQSLPYKSDAAGVLLNVRSVDTACKGLSKLKLVAENLGLDDFSVTVERMVEGIDSEINVGSRYDVEFGPYVFLAVGGVQSRAAVSEEVILPPLDRDLAGKLIKRSKISRYCCGSRSFAIERLEEILIKISQMVVDLPEIEFLILDPLTIADGRLLAVDVKLKLQKSQIKSPGHLATTPYPNQYEFSKTLKDGSEVLIRPIRPDDAAAHKKMVAKFSPETRYFRFFSLREEITQEQLARFTQIDYEREIAIIAEIESEGEKISIGVNRLLYYPHIEEYEFAIVVADEWQHSGAGYLLMDRLIYIAKDRGIKEIFGLVMRNNLNMMDFIKKFGFKVVEREIDVCRVRLGLTDN